MARIKTKYSGVFIEDGKILYSILLGNDKITGKRITKKGRSDSTGKAFETPKEAYDETIRLKAEYNKAHGYGNYNMTFKQFVNDCFMPYYQGKNQKQTCISKQTAINLMMKRFGKTRLREINVRDCENYRLFLLNASGYSQSYAASCYILFRQALDYAVLLELVEFNVAKKTPAIPKSKVHVDYWTKSEFEVVISTIYIFDFYEHLTFITLWLYYVTGLRVSEGLSLQWADINFNKKKLRINKTLNRAEKGKWLLQMHTKTNSGMRTISLDDDTIIYLKRWKKVQNEVGVDSFILSHTGKPLSRSTITRMIMHHAELANVKRIQGKGLRHSHVSYLINEFNADVLMVSKRLGHSSPEITLKHYAHLWPIHDEEIAEMIKGNIRVETSTEKRTKFNGNQHHKVKKTADPSAKLRLIG